MMLDSTVLVVRDSYLATALWSSSDWDDMDDSDNPTPFDENYDCSDFSEDAKVAAFEDCKRFLEALQNTDCEGYDNLYDAADDIQGDGRIGHDLWLTRNGHGAGFWDGDYGDYGDVITDIVHATFGRYSELNLYVNGGGEIDIDG